MSEEKDWNAIFAERLALQQLERAENLKKAKEAAKNTGKEPFNRDKFISLYIKYNKDDINELTPWETILKESEYDYYVTTKNKMTLEEYIKYQLWLDGFA